MVRLRPRELLVEDITGEDLSISYDWYHDCGWPKSVKTINKAFHYEILTVGLNGGIQDVLDTLDTAIPRKAQDILQVSDCAPGMRTRRARQFPTSRKMNEEGILKIGAGVGDAVDFNTDSCTAFKDFGSADDVSCTPVTGRVIIVYDPAVTDSTEASTTVLTGISGAMDDGSLITDNIIGLKMVERSSTKSVTVETDTKSVPAEEVIMADETARAEEPTVVAESPQADSGMSPGGVAGLVIGLLVLAVLAVAFVMRRHQQRQDICCIDDNDREPNKTFILEDDGEGSGGDDQANDKQDEEGVEVGWCGCG